MTFLTTRLSLLRVFVTELPDPQQEIALQDIYGIFNTFTLFQRVPMEIQLSIWRCCFPKSRYIELKTGRCCTIPTHKRQSSICRCAPKRFFQPITLRINHASRQETLRHYQILLRQFGIGPYDNTTFPKCYQKVYINPNRDVLVLNNTSILRYSPYTPYASWFRHISELNSSIFASIKYLQIRQWYVSKSKTWDDLYMEGYDTLEHFSRLEEVRLLLDPMFDMASPFYRRCRRRGIWRGTELWVGRPFDSADTWMSESFIKGIFTKAKAKNPTISVPDVHVCDWKNNAIYKSFFDVIDVDLMTSYPLLQRFLNGEFAAVV